MQLDPELRPHGVHNGLERSASHRTNKTPISLQQPSFPYLTSTTNVSYGADNDFAPSTRPGDHDHSKLQKFHSSGLPWEQPHGVSEAANEQLHSAPISTANILQTHQAIHPHIHLQQHSTVPPATAPFTLGNTTHNVQHYVTQFDTYNSQSTSPLQLQQSSYYSAPATQAVSPASGQGHWYYQAPSSATAISAIRPTLQHMHSVPSIPTTTAYAPMPAHDNAGSGSGHSRSRSFVDLQQEGNSVPVSDSQWSYTAPMMVRESVRSIGHPKPYDPSVSQVENEGPETPGCSGAGFWSHDPPREQSKRPREESEEEEEDAPDTSKEVANYSREYIDRRSLRQRKSLEESSRDEARERKQHREPKATRGRPKKKQKRQEQPVEEDEEVVAVKAGSKGNQFILTLYAMVDAPSSYPLIGWNLPGTAIVIPDTKGFAAGLLNKYFRHSTISSFARQLVSYGFLKTELPAREKAMVTHGSRVDSKHWTFSHNFFLRGRADLLDQVAPPVSPGKPSKVPYAKKSLAAIKREEEAFVDMLKRENTHWRERCQRLEQCMLEEKARANQYLAILMERGLVPGAQPFPQPILPLQALPFPAFPTLPSSPSAEESVENRGKSEESSRHPAREAAEGALKATEDSGRDQVGQTQDVIEVPPSA